MTSIRGSMRGFYEGFCEGCLKTELNCALKQPLSEGSITARRLDPVPWRVHRTNRPSNDEQQTTSRNKHHTPYNLRVGGCSCAATTTRRQLGLVVVPVVLVVLVVVVVVIRLMI